MISTPLNDDVFYDNRQKQFKLTKQELPFGAPILDSVHVTEDLLKLLLGNFSSPVIEIGKSKGNHKEDQVSPPSIVKMRHNIIQVRHEHHRVHAVVRDSTQPRPEAFLQNIKPLKVSSAKNQFEDSFHSRRWHASFRECKYD